MASKTEICNMALLHLGIGQSIGNVDTERSAEALAFLRVYATCLDTTLRAFPWSFANRFVALGLVAQNPAENSEWNYSYRYPSDCVMVRRIQSGFRTDTKASRVPFIIAQDDAGKLIYTDEANAKIVYTKRTANTEIYPADFVLALSQMLAFLAGKPLTGGDPFKLTERAYAAFGETISLAQRNSLAEEQQDAPAETELVSERGDTQPDPHQGLSSLL